MQEVEVEVEVEARDGDHVRFSCQGDTVTVKTIRNCERRPAVIYYTKAMPVGALLSLVIEL